jgi:hypothetical protein
MHVAVQLEFKADRREPLDNMIRRVAELNIAAIIIDELDRTFVAEIEAAVEPAPA